jgi:hypothetical protein
MLVANVRWSDQSDPSDKLVYGQTDILANGKLHHLKVTRWQSKEPGQEALPQC